MNAFPLPNILLGSDSRCALTGTDGSCLQNNYQAHRVQVQKYNDFDVRLDYILSQKDQAFGRYSYGQDVESYNFTDAHFAGRLRIWLPIPASAQRRAR